MFIGVKESSPRHDHETGDSTATFRTDEFYWIISSNHGSRKSQYGLSAVRACFSAHAWSDRIGYARWAIPQIRHVSSVCCGSAGWGESEKSLLFQCLSVVVRNQQVPGSSPGVGSGNRDSKARGSSGGQCSQLNPARSARCAEPSVPTITPGAVPVATVSALLAQSPLHPRNAVASAIANGTSACRRSIQPASRAKSTTRSGPEDGCG